MQARQAERQIPTDDDEALVDETNPAEQPDAPMSATLAAGAPVMAQQSIPAELDAVPFVPDATPPTPEVEVASAMTDAAVSETADPAADQPIPAFTAPAAEAPASVPQPEVVAPTPVRVTAPPPARPTPAAPKAPTQPSIAGAGTPSKPPTRPLGGAGAQASASKSPTRPTTTTAKPVGGGKTPTRPTLSGSGATRATTPASTTKVPSRPLAAASAATAAAAATRGAARPTPAQEAEERYVTKRDLRRDARKAELARVQTLRRQRIQAAKRRVLLIRAAIIGGIIIVALLLGLLIHNLTAPVAPAHTLPVGPNGYVYGSNISCGSEMVATHYHANVQIVVDGKVQPIPADVGIPSSDCLYWLHTHDATGVIHIEAPADQAKRAFYLGDLLAIWHKTPSNTIAAGPPELNANYFFGKPINKQHPLTVYVDGKVYTGDPDQIVLKAHENVWLEYGTPQVTPKNYVWSDGL